MLELKDFTYHEYRALLERVRQGRENRCFADFAHRLSAETQLGRAQNERFFLLRHDVDFCPMRALEMGALEADMGLRATYYLLLTSGLYNLNSSRYRNIPQDLVGLGHEVALHYDLPILEANDGLSPLESLRAQVEVLERLSGTPVQSIAMHNPSRSGADPFDRSCGFVNAYDEAFTGRDIAYYSDSCGAWRDEAHFVLTRGEIPPRVQLLIHPFLWRPEPGDRWDRLRSWGNEQNAHLHEELEIVRDIWGNHSGAAEHDQRVTHS